MKIPFAANLSLLFTEWPMLERVGAAAKAGFDAVEVQFPYAWPAKAWRDALDAHQMRMVLHNVPAGHWAQGERGMACLPDRVDEFQRSVAQALEYATVLGVPQLNVLAGLRPAGVDDATLRRTFIQNIRHAAQAMSRHGVRCLIEPINPIDVPGFYLNRADEALSLLDEAATPNAFVQYDIYHVVRQGEDPVAWIRQHHQRMPHVQIADVPGRHEPGTGTIDWTSIHRALRDVGYKGAIGCEYNPKAGTLAGLDWLRNNQR
jgi:hydroxypyruvate isomerase